MINSPTSGGRVLGVWQDSDREPSHPRDNNPAIVEGNRAIYFGEQLLAPENFESEDVRRLLGNALNYLYNLEPRTGERIAANAESQGQVSDRAQAGQRSEDGLDLVLLAGAALVASIAGYIFLS